jgi:hypothetical protein
VGAIELKSKDIAQDPQPESTNRLMGFCFMDGFLMENR